MYSLMFPALAGIGISMPPLLAEDKTVLAEMRTLDWEESDDIAVHMHWR
jgi:hypothetical protein